MGVLEDKLSIDEHIGDDAKKSSSAVYLLRTTQQHHVHLSSLADQKANILFAICSILFSISIARIDPTHFNWGFISLMLTCLVSIFFAILVITPLNFKRKSTKPIPNTESFNPLFFNHFTECSYKEYNEIMMQITSNDIKVREAMIKDNYQLGVILRTRKYKYLQLSSKALLTGLFISLLIFLVTFILNHFR